MEAVTTLHEAVRVLGASGGGDAAGGAGVAGTLLSRALEIWALDNHAKDEALTRQEMSRTPASRSSRPRAKGKERLASAEPVRRRGVSHDQLSEDWTDEVSQAEPSVVVSDTMEDKVEMELDEEADGLLQQALSRVRGGRLRQQRAISSPMEEVDETPVPAVSRSRNTKTVRGNARH